MCVCFLTVGFMYAVQHKIIYEHNLNIVHLFHAPYVHPIICKYDSICIQFFNAL